MSAEKEVEELKNAANDVCDLLQVRKHGGFWRFLGRAIYVLALGVAAVVVMATAFVLLATGAVLAVVLLVALLASTIALGIVLLPFAIIVAVCLAFGRWVKLI